jgi:hypothetical protein
MRTISTAFLWPRAWHIVTGDLVPTRLETETTMDPSSTRNMICSKHWRCGSSGELLLTRSSQRSISTIVPRRVSRYNGRSVRTHKYPDTSGGNAHLTLPVSNACRPKATMIPETAVFKTRIGNTLHVSGRVSLALAATTIWERAGMFQIAAISPDSRACFLPTSKRTRAPASSV